MQQKRFRSPVLGFFLLFPHSLSEDQSVLCSDSRRSGSSTSGLHGVEDSVTSNGTMAWHSLLWAGGGAGEPIFFDAFFNAARRSFAREATAALRASSLLYFFRLPRLAGGPNLPPCGLREAAASARHLTHPGRATPFS